MAGETWTEPSKKIFDGADISRFRRSLGYKHLHQTIAAVIEKVKGYDVPPGILDCETVTKTEANVPPPTQTGISSKLNLPPPQESPLTDSQNTIDENESDNYNGVLRILRVLDGYIDSTPPLKGPRRFGNLACRDWHDKMTKAIVELLTTNLAVKNVDIDGYITELQYYIVNCFGSKVRLDYGTGHELSFIAFIGGLLDYKVLDINEITGPQMLSLFSKYYDLVRRLILTYSLEPAGSHGVWGLDDHFHFIYILGAAQFSVHNNRVVPPVLQVLTLQTIKSYKVTNLYVNAIAFIHKIKLGPFNEHSPIISDIHATVTLWTKVLSGLLKMYEVEVLGKFPVVQHFWFGSKLYPWVDMDTKQELPVYQKDPEETEEDNDNLAGLINGTRGVNTTRSNVSLTGAPWAMGTPRTARPTTGRFQPPRSNASNRS